jgi:hypothetical protein
MKRWKTEMWTKTFKDMVDRMIRTLRDRISASTRLMTRTRMDQIRFNLHTNEDWSLFRFDMQRGQRNKTMNTLETISVVAVLEYNTPLDASSEGGGGQLEEAIPYADMHVNILFCCGENNAERYDYKSDEAFRRLVHFVRACTSKRVKDSSSAGKIRMDDDSDSDQDDDDDSAENAIASFTDEQRQFFMNKFLGFVVDYVCMLGPYMAETMKMPNHYVPSQIVYQYALMGLYNPMPQ